ncbi:phosphate ABC transporter substrate-binding protein [Pseudoalteromonas sp. SSDWG2]|uniref:phosphate ABC transporter substrate-binding protein n=1 Tax=Pseudoalteromonas sp. SSDWG2 TaxID=3139391 RepID=UPI003BACBB17
MKKLLTCIALLVSCSAAADISVITHPSNNGADEAVVKKLFLGKAKSFNDGSAASPVNQDANAVFDEFNDKVLGKSSSQLNAYWSKLVFTGKGTPPDKLANDQAVIDFVKANPGAIGYVSSASVTADVKVVATY